MYVYNKYSILYAMLHLCTCIIVHVRTMYVQYVRAAGPVYAHTDGNYCTAPYRSPVGSLTPAALGSGHGFILLLFCACVCMCMCASTLFLSGSFHPAHSIYIHTHFSMYSSDSSALAAGQKEKKDGGSRQRRLVDSGSAGQAWNARQSRSVVTMTISSSLLRRSRQHFGFTRR